jgi:hypothetical protein
MSGADENSQSAQSTPTAFTADLAEVRDSEAERNRP